MCSVTTSPTVLSYGGCTATVQIPTCQGQCQSSSMWSYSNGVFKMGGTCGCCQEKSSEKRQIQLTCSGNKMQTYAYMHITRPFRHLRSPWKSECLHNLLKCHFHKQDIIPRIIMI
uniref:CTCK domain-containing protein n=1 Tax=Paramormyrops kingsleyae TaxID=1676925 RepID=A0A3B3ST46_9TELE